MCNGIRPHVLTTLVTVQPKSFTSFAADVADKQEFLKLT